MRSHGERRHDGRVPDKGKTVTSACGARLAENQHGFGALCRASSRPRAWEHLRREPRGIAKRTRGQARAGAYPVEPPLLIPIDNTSRQRREPRPHAGVGSSDGLDDPTPYPSQRGHSSGSERLLCGCSIASPDFSFGSIAGTQERRLTGTRLLWLWRSEPARR